MRPYGKAAWPYTLEEEETYKRLESEWQEPNIFTFLERVFSLYGNLSVPFSWVTNWRTLMHNFIMSWANCERFITQKQSNYELFIFSLNTLAYIIFKGALCSLKFKSLNSFHNWLNKLCQRKISPRTLFKARKVAGSAKYKQCTTYVTVLYCFSQFVYLGMEKCTFNSNSLTIQRAASFRVECFKLWKKSNLEEKQNPPCFKLSWPNALYCMHFWGLNCMSSHVFPPSTGSAWCIQKCPTSVNQTQSC